MNKFLLAIPVVFSLLCCVAHESKSDVQHIADVPKADTAIIDTSGKTIITRFRTPAGYERTAAADNSFAAFLRKLPLKPNGAIVHYYNGEAKPENVYDAVVDLDIGNKDLEQCADAVNRLRGEYLFAQKQYDKIAFHLTNGFMADYSHWMNGYRMVVKGNDVSWQKMSEPSNMYKDFRAYMDVVFDYAGTLSLSKELKAKDVKDIAVGDVFVKGGSPGHAVIVVDVAINKKGEKIFMIAQSYMPAQDIQVLKNPNDSVMSPWYSANIKDVLVTPQWEFTKYQLKCFE